MSSVAEPTHTTVRWDLSSLFSGIDDPRIASTLSSVSTGADAFSAKYRGKVNAPDVSAQVLLDGIIEMESLVQELSKPGMYSQLMFTTNTGDPKLGAFMQKMMEESSEIQVKLMFFELELQALPQTQMDLMLATGLLDNYKHYIEKARLFSQHRMSEKEEVLLEKTANTGCRAWVRLHEEITSNHVFRLASPDGKVEDTNLTSVLDSLRSPERSVRQSAADSLSAGLKECERVLVFTYNNLLQDKKIEDDLRGYGHAEQSRHMDNELDKDIVDLVVNKCVQNFPLVSRFYTVKREILGLPELTHIDRYAPLFDAKEKVDFDTARKMILDAFGTMSAVMRDSADEFFVKNWIDAEPRKGKGGGAYCSSNTPDLHPVVFMSYMNKMDDVMTLAHELGHGIHASYSRKQSLLNFYPTLPMAELASTFGEMLVFESLVSKADRRDRLALYAEKIEGIFATIFRQAAMFRFERDCHEKRRTEGELTPEEFGELWQKNLQLMFDQSVKLGEQHSSWWSYVSHFIGVPFYVYAYSFGELLALSLYQMAKDGGPAFAVKYIDMLSLGGSLTPQELMDVVGVNLKDAAFWDGGFAALERMVTVFEEIWKEEKGGN